MLLSVWNYKIWSPLGTMMCTQQDQKATAGVPAAWQLTARNLSKIHFNAKSTLLKGFSKFFIFILVDKTKIWWREEEMSCWTANSTENSEQTKLDWALGKPGGARTIYHHVHIMSALFKKIQIPKYPGWDIIIFHFFSVDFPLKRVPYLKISGVLSLPKIFQPL